MPTKPLRFHWSLSQAGQPFRRATDRERLTGAANLAAMLDLCQAAEACGIDSMLMAVGYTRPDPLALTVALGSRTERIRFMVACRSGVIHPVTFVHQLNSAAHLIGGRVYVNMVCGHTPHELRHYGDFLDHDSRYARTDEFLDICHGLWRGEPVNYQGRFFQVENAHLATPFSIADKRRRPEIFVGGNSEKAAELAARHGDCLWRFPDAPEALVHRIAPVLDAGKQAGLLVSLIARSTREQAHAAASRLIASFQDSAVRVHHKFAVDSDSTGFRATYRRAFSGENPWITATLWNGAVPYLGAPAIALVGSWDDVAEALLDYQAIGITQFLFMGWPDLDEMKRFARHVLPRVREREASPTVAIGT